MQLCDPLCLRGHIFTCLPKVAMARLAAGIAAGSENYLCVFHQIDSEYCVSP